MNISALHNAPDSIRIFPDDTPAGLKAEKKDDEWRAGEVVVRISPSSNGTAIDVNCGKSPIARLAIHWPVEFPEAAAFLGDAWERSYGELQWRFTQPQRVLPWYFAAHDLATGATVAAGVKTQPAALCFWTVGPTGVTLWLDLRNGGMPSLPGDRNIRAATIVTQTSDAGESPASVVRKLCVKMCDKPRLSAKPICGHNNWYYNYGVNFNADDIRRNAAFAAELAAGHATRPYCLIDAGWSSTVDCPGGPWDSGLPEKFPNMPGLAEEISKLGVEPGIWIRPCGLSAGINPKRIRGGSQVRETKSLDMTMPENLELVSQDIHRMHAWGYRLIKHDFSTWDVLGRWGIDMGADITDGGWHFADRSLTNAEIILRLYQTIREAAGDSAIIGCDTIGHIGAGYFEVQRTGDDTSGRTWERTRRMGVNTLAYRLPQNRTFFIVDADCVAHTELTPWDKTRQWLDVVARSGTALFVSVEPKTVTPEMKTAMTKAMQLALSGGAKEAEAADWVTNTTPTHWKFDGEAVEYDWLEEGSAWPGRS